MVRRMPTTSNGISSASAVNVSSPSTASSPRTGGWITSVPGERTITFECLPGSSLPNTLADLGYDLRPEPDGERVLPHATRTEMIARADGTLSVLTPDQYRRQPALKPT